MSAALRNAAHRPSRFSRRCGSVSARMADRETPCGMVHGLPDIKLASAVPGSYEEPGCSTVVKVDRPGGRLDDDAADVLAFQGMKRHMHQGADVAAEARSYQCDDEALEAVTIMILQGSVIMLQSADRVIISNPDHQASTRVIQQSGDRACN